MISRGHLFHEDRVIPASAIKAVDKQGIHLALSLDELRALPVWKG